MTTADSTDDGGRRSEHEVEVITLIREEVEVKSKNSRKRLR